MISVETALHFFMLNSSLCLMPCAEMVIVITHSSTQGWKSGMAFVAGTGTALLIQVLLMAFGVSAIIQASVTVFHLLKIIGVTYLLFLAWQILMQPTTLASQEGPGLTSKVALFRKGVTLNFSTPMTPLFLLFLIPTFIEIDKGSITSQSLQLGGVLVLSFLCVYTLYCFCADRAGAILLQSEKFRRYLQRIAASTIAGFAIYLAWAQPVL
ncbi:LysE family translocator [Oceanicoccus sagamiensis]|uniref:Lysine transporter LysE n=1 Tax=Oceanicoccus sagamiensis TaxID=716816 RepID=A0A1X9NCF9_9GAMM|nr:LysE family translocator [Oceanicoccus sagamiensis]ARN75276.1 hypothetical protein BST96_14835 [Oceanicoccus sagamiensis]